MKLILAAAAMILSLLLPPRASAAAPIEATLTLPHDQVLPGVPFELVITYINVSDHPLTIGGALATLVVTFRGGETTIMHKPEGHDQSDVMPAAPLRLAPGQSAQQAVSWERGSPNWFKYTSFSGPGTYGIALELQIVDKYIEPLGTVRTDTVTLTRIEPVGIDSELWKRMQDLSGGKWADNWFHASSPGVTLADEIILLHPASGYYPYALALRALMQRKRGDIEALMEAAHRFPASPAHPYLLFAAANSADYKALIASRAGDTDEAEKYFKLAQSNYSAALATKSIAVRDSAEKGVRDVTRGLERLKNRDR